MTVKNRIFLLSIFFFLTAFLAAEIPLDQSPYADILKKYLDEKGFVHYQAMKQEGAEIKLKQYLQEAGSLSLKNLSSSEQFALLINLYNANTIALILKHYPLASIRNLDFPWKQKICLLEGELVSLDHIEHGLIRPRYQDARIHFVLNCSAVSCPPLLPEVFRAKNLEGLLESATRDFINNPRYNQFKITKKGIFKTNMQLEIKTSWLLFWYKKDFIESYGSIEKFFHHFVQNPEAKKYLDQTEFTIDYLSYDWSLNDAAK